MQSFIRSLFTRTTPRRLALPLLVYALAAACTARADTWVRQQEIGSVPTDSGMHLGASIAYDYGLGSGGYELTRLYVGAPLATAGVLAEAGVVYVFNPTPQGWVYFTTLTAHVPKAGAHFGAQVASGQGLILVSAPDYDAVGAPGAGYIEFFADGGAGGVQHLQDLAGGSSGNHYGRAIAISGDMAAFSFVDTADSGCLATLHHTPGAFPSWDYFPAGLNSFCGASAGDALGASLGILRTSSTSFLLVAGAPGETHNGQAAAGGAHVYAPNANGTDLIEIGTLAAQNPALLDVFGTSVGIDANYVYVGAAGRDNGAGRTGSASIFKPAFVIGYDLVTEIFPQSQGNNGDRCGAVLAVDPRRSQFIVGCPSSDGTVANEGMARLYRPFDFLGTTVWLESLLSFGNLPHGADDLGRSIAIFGDTAFAGAPLRDISTTTNHGAVEVFAPDLIFRDGFGG